MRESKGRLVALVVGCLLIGAGALAWAVHRTQALPDGVQPIAFDRTACAHCHMTVSEPRFAAQLQTQEGDVLDFDDPGCLLAYVAKEKPHVRAIWFHDLNSNRWIPSDDARFVRASPSPMDYDLGVTDHPTPGALDFSAALAKVAAEGR